MSRKKQANDEYIVEYDSNPIMFFELHGRVQVELVTREDATRFKTLEAAKDKLSESCLANTNAVDILPVPAREQQPAT